MKFLSEKIRENGGPIRLKLPSVQCVNVNTGLVRLIDPRMESEVESACLSAWADAQTKFVPLPVIGAKSTEGFLMTGRVLGSPDGDGYPTPGAILLIIESPNGAWVLTVGFARREAAGATLWRMLTKIEDNIADRLERPSAPWLAHRISSADGVRGIPRVLPEIEEVCRAIASSLLRYYALIDYINAEKISGTNP